MMKPGTRNVANQMITTLITIEKSPKVTKVTGKNKTLRIGFTIDCKKSNTSAATTSATQFEN